MRAIQFSREWFVGGAVVMAALALLMAGCSDSKSAEAWPGYSAETSTTYEAMTRAQTNQAVMMTGEHGSADTMALRFTVRVVSVREDGGAEVEIALGRLMNRTFGASELRVDYDSDRADEENAPESLFGVYRAALGARVRCSLSDRGEVFSVSGLEEIESALGGSVDGELLGGVFREAWWSGLAESVFRSGSANRRVRTGDTWPSVRTESQDLYMTLSELMEFDVVLVTDDRVEIESSGTFTVDMAKDAFAASEGGSIDEQSLNGRIVWDRAHGRLFELHEERLLQLSQTWQGMEMARRYVVTRTIKRISGNGGVSKGDR